MRRFLVLLFALALLPECARDSPPLRPRSGPPSVVLITIDTLRADFCSAYGYDRPTTPNLDAIGRDGAIFELAYTPMPTTAPAHASLFTSRYPESHGVVQNGRSLAPEEVTFAEVMRANGYRTAAFVSSFVLDERFGLDQGFEIYDDDFEGAESSYADLERWEGHDVEAGFDRRADETTDRVLRWLDEQVSNEPFFLWVHYFDPHHPYAPPASAWNGWEPDEGSAPLERALSAYAAEVAFTDHHLGRLVRRIDEKLGKEATLLVITGDHGEGFFHDYAGHGPILYEEAVRVPLVLRFTGRIPPGIRSTEPISHVDVLPTLSGLLNLQKDATLRQGNDLSNELLGESAPALASRPVFFQRRRYESGEAPTYNIDGVPIGKPRPVKGPMLGVRFGRWKYIQAESEGRVELYDLDADGAEQHNVAPEHPDVVRDLAAVLAAWRARDDGAADRESPLELPEDVRRRLEAIGYVP